MPIYTLRGRDTILRTYYDMVIIKKISYNKVNKSSLYIVMTATLTVQRFPDFLSSHRQHGVDI